MKSPQFHGLKNKGGTCYLNSVLQVLFMTDDFRAAIYRCEEAADSLDQHLKHLFHKLATCATYPEGVKLALGIYNDIVQRDAAEYFEKILSLTSPGISEIFKGELRHITECCKCHKTSDAENTFWTLPLPLEDDHNRSCSVMEALEAFLRPSEVSGEDQLYCENCAAKTNATIGCEIKHHPKVLTILLKRFIFDYVHKDYVKNNSCATIPKTLQNKKHTYDLYAVVHHSGVLKNGHYNAIIKSSDKDKWYDFNDNSVRKVNNQPFQAGDTMSSPSAYMLLYRKREDSLQIRNGKPDPIVTEPQTGIPSSDNRSCLTGAIDQGIQGKGRHNPLPGYSLPGQDDGDLVRYEYTEFGNDPSLPGQDECVINSYKYTEFKHSINCMGSMGQDMGNVTQKSQTTVKMNSRVGGGDTVPHSKSLQWQRVEGEQVTSSPSYQKSKEVKANDASFSEKRAEQIFNTENYSHTQQDGEQRVNRRKQQADVTYKLESTIQRANARTKMTHGAVGFWQEGENTRIHDKKYGIVGKPRDKEAGVSGLAAMSVKGKWVRRSHSGSIRKEGVARTTTQGRDGKAGELAEPRRWSREAGTREAEEIDMTNSQAHRPAAAQSSKQTNRKSCEIQGEKMIWDMGSPSKPALKDRKETLRKETNVAGQGVCTISQSKAVLPPQKQRVPQSHGPKGDAFNMVHKKQTIGQKRGPQSQGYSLDVADEEVGISHHFRDQEERGRRVGIREQPMRGLGTSQMNTWGNHTLPGTSGDPTERGSHPHDASSGLKKRKKGNFFSRVFRCFSPWWSQESEEDNRGLDYRKNPEKIKSRRGSLSI